MNLEDFNEERHSLSVITILKSRIFLAGYIVHTDILNFKIQCMRDLYRNLNLTIHVYLMLLKFVLLKKNIYRCKCSHSITCT